MMFTQQRKTNSMISDLMQSAIRTALVVLGAGFTVNAFAASQPPDLSGIWQVQGNVVELKTIDGKAPPLKAGPAKLYAARKAQLRRGDKSFDPSVKLCKPPGTPRILFEPFPIEIVQTPTQVFFTYQWNRLYRIVDIDENNSIIAPTYFGTSNARWKGDVLEIDVQGLHDDTLLDSSGLPHSEQLHVTERYQLQNQGKQLIVTMQIDDPSTFTRTWESRVTLNKLATNRLGEDVCEERVGLAK